MGPDHFNTASLASSKEMMAASAPTLWHITSLQLQGALYCTTSSGAVQIPKYIVISVTKVSESLGSGLYTVYDKTVKQLFYKFDSVLVYTLYCTKFCFQSWNQFSWAIQRRYPDKGRYIHVVDHREIWRPDLGMTHQNETDHNNVACDYSLSHSSPSSESLESNTSASPPSSPLSCSCSSAISLLLWARVRRRSESRPSIVFASSVIWATGFWPSAWRASVAALISSSVNASFLTFGFLGLCCQCGFQFQLPCFPFGVTQLTRFALSYSHLATCALHCARSPSLRIFREHTSSCYQNTAAAHASLAASLSTHCAARIAARSSRLCLLSSHGLAILPWEEKQGHGPDCLSVALNKLISKQETVPNIFI